MNMRFRHTFMIVGSVLVMLIWILTDPDLGLIQSLPFGSSLVSVFIVPIKSIIYISILHISRKALADYIDLKTVLNKALETPQGAGQVAIAVSLLSIAAAIVIYAATHET